MATTKATRMCVITIGVDQFLLPAAAGLKVAELMQGAQPVNSEYVSGVGYQYSPETIRSLRDVSWTAVSQAQIKNKPARARRQARTTDEPGSSTPGAA